MKSDVEVLEIENPKEVDAQPSEISLHVEGLKLDDDVKKTLASKDGENKDALKDKEELLKEDDDVCEEVKEIEVGEVVLDHPEEKEIVAKRVDNEENVSEKVPELVELDEEEEKEDDLQIVCAIYKWQGVEVQHCECKCCCLSREMHNLPTTPSRAAQVPP